MQYLIQQFIFQLRSLLDREYKGLGWIWTLAEGLTLSLFVFKSVLNFYGTGELSWIFNPLGHVANIIVVGFFVLVFFYCVTVACVANRRFLEKSGKRLLTAFFA